MLLTLAQLQNNRILNTIRWQTHLNGIKKGIGNIKVNLYLYYQK